MNIASTTNTISSKIATGINLGSPNGIPATPTNTIEIMTLKTKDSDFITVLTILCAQYMYFNSSRIIIRQSFKFKYQIPN
jgi:hypothetical protein